MVKEMRGKPKENLIMEAKGRGRVGKSSGVGAGPSSPLHIEIGWLKAGVVSLSVRGS